MIKTPLPIDELIPQVCELLQAKGTLILQAAPGAGKTTRVPPALTEICLGKILVLEPRRLAARLSAERIAKELGETCGKTVGFHIRFEQMASASTRIKFITEGLFLRYLLADPLLSDVECVVLDEFHERHIHTDVALALVRHLQRTSRPDLKLVIMSATMHSERLAEFCDGAPYLISEGKTFPVEIQHSDIDSSQRSLDILVADAVSQLLRSERCPGDILVFLPGVAEIRKAAQALENSAPKENFALLELRADIPASDQQKVFEKSPVRKVILATNIAETSITIDGVTGVVDSGLAKVAGYASWSGLSTLDVRKISQASCIQRAGRAGRTAPGIARRLFSNQEFAGRAPFEKPEILRVDLTDMVLSLHLLAMRGTQIQNISLQNLPWFEPPPATMLAASTKLLQRIDALDADESLTPLGARIAEIPLHPRLARVIIEGEKLGQGAQACLAAALISERMILRRGLEAVDIADSDVGFQMEILRKIIRGEKLSGPLMRMIDIGKAKRVHTLAKSLVTYIREPADNLLEPHNESTLALCLLAGFPDRVAQVRQTTSATKRTTAGKRIELNLCQGGGALLSTASVVQDNAFLIAIDAEESVLSANASTATQIHVACGIETHALLSGPAEFLQEMKDISWDEQSERVRGATRLLYGNLILEESPVPLQRNEAEEILQKALAQRWPKPFSDAEPLAFYKARCDLVRANGFALTTPDLAGEDFELFLAAICEGKKSFSEIASDSLQDYIDAQLSHETRQLLEEVAPTKITIGAGRKVVVHYEEDKPPWIASRLQDFFGTQKTPTILKGRLPVVVHLLAPSGQSLQVTNDLESFWKKVYPLLRKEYGRRYPKHSWPEDPLTAQPPEIRKRPPSKS